MHAILSFLLAKKFVSRRLDDIKLSVIQTAVFHLYIIWHCDETTIALIVFLKVGQVSESSAVVVKLFCLIFLLPKSKNLFYPQQYLLCQRMIFLKRAWGRFPWKNVVNLPSDAWIFVFTGTNFGNACTKLVSLCDETLMKYSCKQARILLRSGSLRLLKFLKQFHANRHIIESRGETFGRRNTQQCLNFSFPEKWQTISNQSATQWVFRACFLRTHNIWFSGNNGWKRYLCRPFALWWVDKGWFRYNSNLKWVRVITASRPDIT